MSSTSPTKVRLEPANKYANRPYRVMGQSFTPMSGDKPFTQTGTASWYGKQFHGKKTAIGDVYDMYAMTAAHPTMELPSYAKVTNLANGRSVIVRVNDRGPFIGGRAIDMSYAAAVKLGYQKKGTTRVRIERITRSQIARGDIPSATHTNVTLADALAATPSTTAQNNITAPAPSQLAAAKPPEQTAGLPKSTLPPAEKSTVFRQNFPLLAPATHLPASGNENAQTSDAITSYLPQAEVSPTASDSPATPVDPLLSLLPADNTTIVEELAEDDSSQASVMANADNDSTELKLLDSEKKAWGAQIGAFDNKTKAQEFAAHTEMMLTTEGITAPVRIASSANLWCVMVGSTTQSEAREIARTISNRLGTTAFAAFK